jgi:hypothetical protein
MQTRNDTHLSLPWGDIQCPPSVLSHSFPPFLLKHGALLFFRLQLIALRVGLCCGLVAPCIKECAKVGRGTFTVKWRETFEFSLSREVALRVVPDRI